MVHSPVHALSADEKPTCLPLAPEESAFSPSHNSPSLALFSRTPTSLVPLLFKAGLNKQQSARPVRFTPIKYEVSRNSSRLLRCSFCRSSRRHSHAERFPSLGASPLEF